MVGQCHRWNRGTHPFAPIDTTVTTLFLFLAGLFGRYFHQRWKLDLSAASGLVSAVFLVDQPLQRAKPQPPT